MDEVSWVPKHADRNLSSSEQPGRFQSFLITSFVAIVIIVMTGGILLATIVKQRRQGGNGSTTDRDSGVYGTVDTQHQVSIDFFELLPRDFGGWTIELSFDLTNTSLTSTIASFTYRVRLGNPAGDIVFNSSILALPYAVAPGATVNHTVLPRLEINQQSKPAGAAVKIIAVAVTRH